MTSLHFTWVLFHYRYGSNSQQSAVLHRTNSHLHVHSVSMPYAGIELPLVDCCAHDPLHMSSFFIAQAAVALNSVITPQTVVEFSMSGEQGLSVFTYPKSWMAATDRTRALISANGKNKVKHTFGHSFNWDKVRFRVKKAVLRQAPAHDGLRCVGCARGSRSNHQLMPYSAHHRLAV